MRYTKMARIIVAVDRQGPRPMTVEHAAKLQDGLVALVQSMGASFLDRKTQNGELYSNSKKGTIADVGEFIDAFPGPGTVRIETQYNCGMVIEPYTCTIEITGAPNLWESGSPLVAGILGYFRDNNVLINDNEMKVGGNTFYYAGAIHSNIRSLEGIQLLRDFKTSD
jgi:hypothetical protein